MSLPKPVRPEYSTTIPSTGKRIKYQPFSVREEKTLILASESKDQDEITNAITNVLERCVTSPADFKVADLALFDIEYLFLKTRSKSAGEKITVSVTDPDDETYSVEHEINIDKIGVTRDETHTDLIEIDEETSIKMKYPDINFFNEGINMNDIASSIKVLSRCISQIIIGEEVHNRADLTDNEIAEWIEGLTSEQFGKMTTFFATMPRLSHTITLPNKNTGKDFTIVLEGLSDFF